MAPTFFEWAYLGMAIGGWVAFAVVVNWATNRTVPKTGGQAAQGNPVGARPARA